MTPRVTGQTKAAMNVSAMPVLVTGATGNTGSAVVDQLVQRGVPVRVMVRNQGDAEQFDGQRASAVVADFDDASSLAAALSGVDRAYLVTPSSERAEEQQVRFARAAMDGGVRQLVVLSQLAADPDSPVRFLRWHAAAERGIRDTGIGHTFLRPNLFFQGLLPFARTIASSGRFFAPIGDARVSAVDVRDIAGVAVAALTQAGHQGRTYTITGPAAITHAEMAAALSAALGREITFSDAPPQAFAESLRGVLPPWQADGLLEDYAHYRSGEAAAVYPTVAEVAGGQPRTFRQFADDYKAAFAPG